MHRCTDGCNRRTDTDTDTQTHRHRQTHARTHAHPCMHAWTVRPYVCMYVRTHARMAVSESTVSGLLSMSVFLLFLSVHPPVVDPLSIVQPLRPLTSHQLY